MTISNQKMIHVDFLVSKMKDWFGGIASMVALIALVGGYIMNIVQLVQNDYSQGMLMVKAVGIFIAPLGIVMGWIG